MLQKNTDKFYLTDKEFENLKAVLLSRGRPVHLEFRGQLLKSSQMEVLDEENVFEQKQEYSWSDEELTKWEDEIFSRFDKFEDYMIVEGAWAVDDKYPIGVIKNPEKYHMLEKKWNALQLLRRQRKNKK